MQTGLLGIILAGLLAGGLSTYDSIGSALAAVFTRDLYARFLVTDADDQHYLKTSRITTVVVIALSFAYVPFLGGGMVAFYLKITGVAVVPLMIVYLMGVLTPVARGSATAGLIVGIVCGLSRFNRSLAWPTGVGRTTHLVDQHLVGLHLEHTGYDRHHAGDQHHSWLGNQGRNCWPDPGLF